VHAVTIAIARATRRAGVEIWIRAGVSLAVRPRGGWAPRVAAGRWLTCASQRTRWGGLAVTIFGRAAAEGAQGARFHGR
jgi:hypothetical protein